MPDLGQPRPTRTVATQDAYLKRGAGLWAMAARETGVEVLSPMQFVRWYLAMHRRWSCSTLRQYRAAIKAVLKDMVEIDPDLGGQVDPDLEAEIALALATLDTIVDSDAQQLNRPEPTLGTQQTSARKRKAIISLTHTPDGSRF